MAMQSSIGLTKIVFLVGAGYTSTILLQNNKLSDLLRELQKLAKNYEKGEGESTDGDYSDAISGQVKRLAMEVRQLASAHPITVFNGNSSQNGNITSLIVPATVLGTVGYGYMWWKGLSFSDLMYVTKRNMATAVSNMTKHLEHVSEALAATKRHLTQRIENLDGKLDEQVELSKLIRNEVGDVCDDLSRIGLDLNKLQGMVSGLDSKIMTLEEKQDIANFGVWYLCNKADGIQVTPKQMKEKFTELSGKPASGFLPAGGMGIKDIADCLLLRDKVETIANPEDGIRCFRKVTVNF